MTDQQTPPWGDDANFDPEKAWSLIQNLRGDVERLKSEKAQAVSERDALTSERDELASSVDELKATVQLTDDAVKEKEREFASLSTLRTKENLLLDAGLPRDLAENVTGEDEDAWKASVKRFSALRGEAGQERRPDPAQEAGNSDVDPREAAARQFFGA